jgi:hypothetical protein
MTGDAHLGKARTPSRSCISRALTANNSDILKVLLQPEPLGRADHREMRSSPPGRRRYSSE